MDAGLVRTDSVKTVVSEVKGDDKTSVRVYVSSCTSTCSLSRPAKRLVVSGLIPPDNSLIKRRCPGIQRVSVPTSSQIPRLLFFALDPLPLFTAPSRMHPFLPTPSLFFFGATFLFRVKYLKLCKDLFYVCVSQAVMNLSRFVSFFIYNLWS